MRTPMDIDYISLRFIHLRHQFSFLFSEFTSCKFLQSCQETRVPRLA
jgi:hypothetical protein